MEEELVNYIKQTPYPSPYLLYQHIIHTFFHNSQISNEKKEWLLDLISKHWVFEKSIFTHDYSEIYRK